MTDTRFLRSVEATSIVLFFLQALRVIFSVLFGIIYDQVFAGSPDAWLPVSVLLVFIALALPALAPRSPTHAWLAVLAAVAAVARVALTFNDATLRYWGALIVLGSAGLYLAGLLTARRSLALPSLLTALAIDQILRAVGQTFDLSLQAVWLPAQILWAALIVGIALALAWMGAVGDRQANLMGVRASLGLGGLLFLETSLLSLPNGVARWTGAPYAVFAPLLFLLTLLPTWPRLRFALGNRLALRPMLRLGVPAGLTAALMVGYFGRGLVGALGLVLAAILALGCMVILLDGRSPRQRSVGQMLALAFGLVLLLNFLNAFAFTYPYAVPQLRNMGWAVYLAACVAVMFGASSQRPVALAWQEFSARSTRTVLAGLAGLALIIAAVWPRSADALPAGGTLRLATYNIHYGYDAEWHFNLDAMAEAIAEAGVDAIALQEVDTGRMTSYCVDDALYLAHQLRMNVAYLPTMEHLTGIAVLYRGPQAPASMAFLTSLQEQTGIVGVELEAGGRPLHAFGVWMGLSNEDTLRQITEALVFIGNRTPASFGGDFNAEDDEPVAQAVVQAGFEDPFTLLGQTPPPPTDPAVEPDQRIDYVWVRGLSPTRAWVADSLASDHRLVVAEVQIPR
jgi:endonuclease/exonuclease/phosphatase family metal-dependent hydrolase